MLFGYRDDRTRSPYAVTGDEDTPLSGFFVIRRGVESCQGGQDLIDA